MRVVFRFHVICNIDYNLICRPRWPLCSFVGFLPSSFACRPLCAMSDYDPPSIGLPPEKKAERTPLSPSSSATKASQPSANDGGAAGAEGDSSPPRSPPSSGASRAGGKGISTLDYIINLGFDVHVAALDQLIAFLRFFRPSLSERAQENSWSREQLLAVLRSDEVVSPAGRAADSITSDHRDGSPESSSSPTLSDPSSQTGPDSLIASATSANSANPLPTPREPAGSGSSTNSGAADRKIITLFRDRWELSRELSREMSRELRRIRRYE